MKKKGVKDETEYTHTHTMKKRGKKHEKKEGVKDKTEYTQKTWRKK